MPENSRRASNSSGSGRTPLAAPDEVADYLGVPVKTLYQWHHRRIGPNVLKVGRHLRYRWPEVEEWLTAQSTYGLSA
ncbi:helix-turn-helix transcriptional regulator [Streptomyces reniochalinae]|uniref:DNA-binding protein n=1 Tax=Streptomyces reniochalinae TaxID=2250578 RepID=A0A367EAR0_9ACTN|nr:helix-turn-helix domain-containing protein [Streptomyces reniochalinae]RCG15073.1 DNA-binding protein [Streptomyces reniochalinae]